MTMAQGNYCPEPIQGLEQRKPGHIPWRRFGRYFTDNAAKGEEGMGAGARQMEHAQLLDFWREVQYSGSMGTYQRSLGQLRQMDERRILENGTTHFLYRQYLA